MFNPLLEANILPSDSVSVALVAAALKLGTDLRKWSVGKQDSAHWVKEMGVLHFNSNQKLTLDEWNVLKRNALVQYAQSQTENLPDFFAKLRLYEEKTDSKIRGGIYTPAWLSGRVTKNAFDHWRRLHRNGSTPKLIADVSCGVGSFLYQARNIFGKTCQLLGIDNDPNSLVYCELLNCALNDNWILLKADSLAESVRESGLFAKKEIPIGRIDILLGNPPYIRSQLLSRKYASQLRKLYPGITKGNFDLSILFIEQAIQALADGGIASYVLTSKFMISKYGEAIRKRLASDVRIINIEDFGDMQLFEGRTTYTCVLTFAKLPPANRFTVTSFPSGINMGHGFSKGQSFTLPSAHLSANCWEFVSGEEQIALRKLRDVKNPLLTDIFTGIIQGIRTGANQVFLIESDDVDLEAELLLPFVSGEDIRRLECKIGRVKLLFPYKRNIFGEPVLISEDELRHHYPKTWEYLMSKKFLLLERSFERGAEWFGYSRTQNLGSPWARKLLVREMMPRTEFAADLEGELAFSSGYALIANRMANDDLLLWTAILNTPTMEFTLRRSGTQLHSGWFRLLKHHLNRVRLPALSNSQRSSAKHLVNKLVEQPTNNKLWEMLDDIVVQNFGLTDKEHQSIHDFLRSCHERSLSGKDYSSQDPYQKPQHLRYEPVRLENYNLIHLDKPDLRGAVTFVENKNLPIYRWYPMTQGFSERLVLFLLNDLKANSKTLVFDPFAGCGTTNLVCRLQGIPSLGLDISPLMVWIANVKTRRAKVKELEGAVKCFRNSKTLLGNPETLYFKNYLSKAYSPYILRQLCGIAEFIRRKRLAMFQKDFLFAGLTSITEQVSLIRKHGSHYRFMNASENIGLQRLNTQLIPHDSEILPIYMNKLKDMLNDIRSRPIPLPEAPCLIVRGDARMIPFPNNSVDLVITSPPYLNRNNYIAQQKAELGLLGLVTNADQYRTLVRQTLRSHVEAALDKEPKSSYDEIAKIVSALSLTENNNPKIPHMIAGYFEDLGEVIKELSRIVKVGGECAFVVANSRWGGVVVPVDHLLMMIAEQNSFKPKRILVTRLKSNSPQQMRRYGRIPLRESIVIFEKV